LSNAKARQSPKRLRASSTRHPFSLARLLGRFDAATTTTDNSRHWAAADGLSANSANNAQVRRILRNRARYEVANNCLASELVFDNPVDL
jgi:capsid protein